MTTKVQKHFVTFYSPGTLFSETTEKPIKDWNVATAKRMVKNITERYGSTPYGFRFSTRARGAKDLDSKVVKTSPMYYLNAKVETYEEIVERNLPEENILRSNMRINGYKKIVTNGPGSKTYKFTLPLEEKDIVL